MRGLVANLFRLAQQLLCGRSGHEIIKRERSFRVGRFQHVSCSNCEWLGYYQ